MQAVADRLGVDRSTINYHFADRDELFAVVASASLSAELMHYDPPADGDWREWLLGYARSVHSALRKREAIVLVVRLPLGSDVSSLEPVEGLITKMLDAGFDKATVSHAIAYISEVVHAVAQNELLSSRGTHPQGVELIRFLEGQPAGSLPGIRRLVEVNPLGSEDHLEFALGMIIAGLDARLANPDEPASRGEH